MKKQKNTREMEKADKEPWFNIRYGVSKDELHSPGCFPSGEIIPHPVGMKMTIEQFREAQQRIRESPRFLEVECHKLESSLNDPTSVKLLNGFRAAYGGPLTRDTPEATIDAGFGEMYHRTYVCIDRPGVVTLRTSTGNKYANEMSLYCFTKEGFKEAADELKLPIRETL